MTSKIAGNIVRVEASNEIDFRGYVDDGAEGAAKNSGGEPYALQRLSIHAKAANGSAVHPREPRRAEV